MTSRARSPDLQLGIRLAWVCLLGIISSVAAQDSIPPVASSAAPEAQSTVPPTSLIGTYIDPYGTLWPITCASGGSFTTTSTYAGCWPSGVPEGLGAFPTQCDGSVIMYIFHDNVTCPNNKPDCCETTIFDHYPSPIRSWVRRDCGLAINATPTLYYEVDITQHVTVTKTSGTLVVTTAVGATLVVTRTIPVSPSDIPPDNKSTTGPVSSSSGSEDNSSTTTGDSAPASSTLPDIYDHPVVPETHARPASSRAWIAGVVAGPLLALVAVGGLLYWLKRHRQRKTLVESGGSGPGVHASDLPCIQADFGQSAELSGKTSDLPPMCELEATEVHPGPFQGTGGAMRL